MLKKWKIAEEIPKEFQNQFPEISPLVLQMLYNRGLRTQEEFDEFLYPDYSQDLHDPFLFRDMKKAIKRIFKALKKEEKIVIYGDYDTDGVCSVCLLVSVLKYLETEFFNKGLIDIYLPHRETEGYGLNETSIKEIAKQKTNLIITCDCGISNYQEIELAKKLDIDVIVTDHHCEPSKLPKAFAVINPKLKSETYPFKNLAGVGVAFKLAQALLEATGITKEKEAFKKWLLDLVALGTVVDVMPLLGENRTLVKYGLIVLNKTKRKGLQELIKAAGLSLGDNNKQTEISKQLDSRNVAFQLGPRLNVAGRLDHSNKAYQLLITEDREEARRIAQELNETNRKRQKMTEEIIEKAKFQIEKDKKILFVIDPLFLNKDIPKEKSKQAKWLAGTLGLIAGKLKDEFYRPTIAVTKNEEGFIGAGRSIEEFDLYEALKESKEHFFRFGGHTKAAGFSIRDKKTLFKFKEKIEEIAEKKLADLDFVPSIFIEKEVTLGKINWDFYRDLEKFTPFGQENPLPKFLIRNLIVMGLERVGQEEKHLRIIVKEDSKIIDQVRKMIGFNLGEEWGGKLKMGDRIDVVFELGLTQWNGQEELQMKIKDLNWSR